ncbi:protocadherin Fat 4-like [Thunnus albacares]|uniref:protocadherin Fat 4-like n=1 Tax=Thunnus albacares TaxID=8236 RepID=UPI001CF67F1C|nr:protocadherin Fat 4-like [Thunnus albacares]
MKKKKKTGNTTINCNGGGNLHVGAVDEGYSGDVELVNDITEGAKLVPYSFPEHLQFLELSFTPGETSATVRTKKPLDADADILRGSTLFYSIMCDGLVKYNNTRTLKINDLNDNAPIFKQKVYRKSVSEIHPVDTEVLQVTAEDADNTAANNRVTYSIEPASEDFEVINSGAFILKRRLNYNLVQKYSFTVKAKDSGGKFDTATVDIDVVDFDNLNPYFIHNLYQAFIPENQAGSFRTIQPEAIKAQDGDTGINMTLTYSINAVSPDKYRSNFNIDSSSGVLSLVTAIDREEMNSSMISVDIKAAQTDDTLKTAVASVSVTVEDVNDNPPEFDQSDYSVNLLENSPVDAVLLKVIVTDRDQGGFVGTLRILPESAPFSIGSDGTVRVKNSTVLDRETTESITFQCSKLNFHPGVPERQQSCVQQQQVRREGVCKSDSGNVAGSGGIIPHSSSVQANIRASGDSKPQFLQKVFNGTVEEEQDPGVLIVKVNFHAIPAEVPVTLQVDTYADKFAISPTGEFTTTLKLDYDEAPHNYTVQISISDGTNSDTAVVEVQVTDINDNSPVFASNSVTKSVPEDAEVGSNVTRVLATDKDSSFNKEIRYSLRGGEGRFSIDPVSGIVSVADALDRESKAEYNLQVIAEDQGRPARSSTATLLIQVSDINDNVPKFSEAEYEVEVLETESVGTSVLSLSAVDPDEGSNGNITYSIFKQSPSSDPAVFELDSSSGTLRLAQPLDYSEVKVYRLMVQASDGGTPSLVGNGSVVVKVKDVNNNPPEFSKESYDVAVSENLASGASILTLEVTDKDEGGFSNGYFLYTNNTFDINNQGVVSLRKDVTLDRETKDSYILQVVAVDHVTDGLRATAQLNITVLDYNDNAPQFPDIPDPLFIPEGDYSEDTPGEVFPIRPTDADLGLNGEVALTLASDNSLFRFREDGMLLAVGALDRESKESYDLLIRASDKGSPQRENITTISVSLIDVNDNRPEFSSSSYVSSILLKDAEEGKLLLTLSATDRDAKNNSVITYSFCEGGSPYLALNSKTGEVSLTSDLADVTEDTTVVLTAMAKDHGHPPLNSTARVVVSLEEGVAFQSSSYNFSLPENRPAGVTVGKVWASSGSDLYDVAYTLKTHTDVFSVNANGAILTKTELDKEKQEWYILDVEAVDTRSPPTTAIAMVRIQVEDVNEAPQFSSEVYNASIFSIAPYKTPVVQLKASDSDVGDEGQLVYSLSAASPYFNVEASSGLVFVVSAVGLAGETAKVEVKVTDPEGLHATAMVEVEVQGSASSSDVVTISLNQPADVVEKNVLQMKKSLEKALGWTVTIIEVSSSKRGAAESRTLRADAKTLVSFIAVDEGEVVSFEDVKEKLQSESAVLTAELVKVFGEGVQFDVLDRPQDTGSDQTLVITLSVVLGLLALGLIVAVVLIR